MERRAFLKINSLDGNGSVFLDKAYNILIKEQMLTRTKGFETLSFRYPLTAEKIEYIKPEREIECNDRIFRIKKITTAKTSQKTIDVECDALWLDLNDGEPRNHENSSRLTATEAIQEQLVGTDWTVGEVDVEERHAYTIHSFETALYILRYIQRLFNGELSFDTRNKKVNFLKRIGTDTNLVVDYRQNLKGITRNEDTTELTTRVYMTGKDGITIAPINNGLDYIENYSWYDEQNLPHVIKTYYIEDERFTILENMRDYMQARLDTYCRPIVTYTLEQFIIDKNLELGDSIIVSDKDFGLDDVHRIVEKTINICFPEQSTYILDFSLDDLSSLDDTDDSEINTDEKIEDVNTELQDHIQNLIRHVTSDERDLWQNTATNFNAHAANGNIHVTLADKTKWNGYEGLITTLQEQVADLENRVAALEGA